MYLPDCWNDGDVQRCSTPLTIQPTLRCQTGEERWMNERMSHESAVTDGGDAE